MPLQLFHALAEFFISQRHLPHIAKGYSVEHPALLQAVQQSFQHTWRGKLVSALENPNHRPDLIPLYSQLARLEEHYSVLMKQFDRAEEMCASMRSHKDPLPYLLLMKADIFANRLAQQCTRILKEIQKTELALQKACSSLPVQSVNSPDTLPAGSPLQSQPEASARNTTPPDPNSSVSICGPNPPEPEQKFPYSKQEFEAVLLKNRHRIKNTPAKDRPKLIFALLEAHRAKLDPAPQNTAPQNSKLAA